MLEADQLFSGVRSALSREIFYVDGIPKIPVAGRQLPSGLLELAAHQEHFK